MSEVAEKTADVVAENVEDAIDGVVDVVEVVKSNPKVAIAAAVVGCVLGGVGGYFLAKKRLESIYDERISQEIAEAKEFYANLNKVDVDGAILTPQDVMTQRHGVEAAAAALRDYQGQEPDEEGYVEVEPGILVNVEDETQIRKLEKQAKESFNTFTDDGFDLEHEKQFRTEDKPYIITHDEYFAAERDYETASLTYFEVDDTLVDERDQPIEETDPIVGDEHLARFGSGSKDKNIVYIRNDRLGIDYEITKSKGSYLEEVLGLPEKPDSLKHSNRNAQLNRRREFRHGDG